MASQASARRAMVMTTGHAIEDARVSAREAVSIGAHHDLVLVACHDDQNARPFGLSTVLFPAATNRRARVLRCASFIRFARSQPPSIAHLHDIELFPAVRLLQRFGHKVIVDLHEDYPAQLHHKPRVPNWVKPAASRFMNLFIRDACRTADGVVVASPEIADNCPVESTLVQNFPRFEEFAGASGQAYGRRDALVVSIGTNTKERAFLESVDAMNTVAQTSGIASVIAGPLFGEAVFNAADCAHERVEFPGRIDRQQVAALLNRATIGLCLLHYSPQYAVARPTKLFEYMAAGIPVIGVNFGSVKEIVQRAGCGILVDPTSTTQIAEAVETLVADPDLARKMGERGYNHLLKNYLWETEEARLLDLYARLA